MNFRFTGFIMVVLFIFSCSRPILEKPANLIPEDRMVDIYYDVSILKAAKSTGLKILEEHNIEPDKYIYQKYDIDSLQLAESTVYYVSKPAICEQIYARVEERLLAMKQIAEDSLKQANTRKEDSHPVPPKRDEETKQ
ncbi:DUF4296 domain-containing protein [Robertkochia solimangrovi]|uniref:DUF4296 domain-containing protein n=1 Tax=Robertkochia solimangrovi TaxID=2213046 RepID=UPI00117C7A59|nr:DUF4296 domain-containing protein [Robertkochia solimangrovi]TRZ46296.1 DUF4296 domain-containing protein [Robertkochia solimangrovi]